MSDLFDDSARTKVTLQDVAGRAGVSRSTVSLVLRDSPLVAGTTRARVFAAIAATGYVYNRGAANLRANHTKTIGLALCDITNPFFGELAAGVDEVLDAAGYAAFLVNTGESLDKQERFFQRMREQSVDGVIICPAPGTGADLIERLREWNLPCVQTPRHVSAREGNYAGVDFQLGMELVTEHLIRLGHRRIALVGGEYIHSAMIDRRTAFARAMTRHGLATDLIVKCPLDRRTGADVVGALLERSDPATAAIGVNDTIAFGMMTGLRDRGLEPGVDFAVAGFDDVPEAAMARPALTTVSTQPHLIGKEAAALLLRRIADPSGPCERVILPTRLIIRESCGGGGRREALLARA